ncbi:proline racemase [Anseongella ginsenosidimutans]|uniref:Proline racemase n=1 Tax=Anseongella ginsenosidimutans TaxID=496056 RepID=A0A4R3KWB7_9SPHI|nr:4-hydroxyproline epimerase [Anseongella ginsenosidimutans]QEC51258.1 4-hydroxyproline epimerase [Anseongella ginsenosidimutans]TCS90057.1 proline racemase [Anseongella ginsenosidimutans]
MSAKTFFCIDAHTCGNPVRLVTGGAPVLEGNDMMEKRLHFLKEYDWIRKALMFEPRGHDMMSGSILYPPQNRENDMGILFIETSGCLPMCGHGTIGTVTIAIEHGLIQAKVPGMLRLETPAGLVIATYKQEGKKVTSVRITNVPSYLAAENIIIDCPGLGKLTADVAYGGNFYAIIDRQENFPGIEHVKAEQLISWSRECRRRINEEQEFIHPENGNIRGVSHLLWGGESSSVSAPVRNAVFYGDKAIDRSPCGTGTSARMAQWYSQGKLKKGDSFIHESFIGSRFTGTIEEETSVGGKAAIIPSIEGWAMVTGFNTILVDEDDPYAGGFQVI